MEMNQVYQQLFSISKAITNTIKMMEEDKQAQIGLEKLKEAEKNYQQALVFNLSQPIRNCH